MLRDPRGQLVAAAGIAGLAGYAVGNLVWRLFDAPNWALVIVCSGTTLGAFLYIKNRYLGL